MSLDRRDLLARLGATTIAIVGREGTPIRHARKRFGPIDYCHYLPELPKKPQAVRQVQADLLRDLGHPISGGVGALPRRPSPAGRT